MRQLDVRQVVSVSAVGSLCETCRPRDVVLPDQYFDRTKRWREHTFCGDGVVGHIAFGNPVCGSLAEVVARAAEDALAVSADPPGRQLHRGGIYVNMEGPAFSTRAESVFYHRAGFNLIGMTSLYEARLCREAGICYQPICMVTDYDSWRESEDHVSVAEILENLRINTDLGREIIRRLCDRLATRKPCGCGVGLAAALVTAPDARPPETLQRLALLLRDEP